LQKNQSKSSKLAEHIKTLKELVYIPNFELNQVIQPFISWIDTLDKEMVKLLVKLKKIGKKTKRKQRRFLCFRNGRNFKVKDDLA
jgi:hypothetical protein